MLSEEVAPGTPWTSMTAHPCAMNSGPKYLLADDVVLLIHVPEP